MADQARVTPQVAAAATATNISSRSRRRGRLRRRGGQPAEQRDQRDRDRPHEVRVEPVRRGELEPDEDMNGFVKRQLAELARQVSKYEEEPWQPVSLGDARLKIDGLLLILRYKQQGKFVFHRQAVFPIPDKKHLLTFTASLPVPFTAAHMQQFADVLRSYVPRG